MRLGAIESGRGRAGEMRGDGRFRRRIHVHEDAGEFLFVLIGAGHDGAAVEFQPAISDRDGKADIDGFANVAVSRARLRQERQRAPVLDGICRAVDRNCSSRNLLARRAPPVVNGTDQPTLEAHFPSPLTVLQWFVVEHLHKFGDQVLLLGMVDDELDSDTIGD